MHSCHFTASFVLISALTGLVVSSKDFPPNLIALSVLLFGLGGMEAIAVEIGHSQHHHSRLAVQRSDELTLQPYWFP